MRLGAPLYFLAALPVFCLLPACGSDVPERVFTTRDSAGVVIAENVGPPPEPHDGAPAGIAGWALSPESSLEIGAIDGDDAYLFSRIRGATRLTDGRIAVVDSRAADLRVFDARGRHLRTFGRKGEGPGEFGSPTLLGAIPGDTLVVLDSGLRRINLFHPETGFVRSATVGEDVPGYLQTAGMFASGAVVVHRTVQDGGAAEGYARRPIEFRAVGLDGALVAELGTFPGYETVQALIEGHDGTSVMVGAAPFGKEAATAIGAGHFFCGIQDPWEIARLRPDGTVDRVIRWAREPAAVTAAQVDAFIEDVVADLPDHALAQRYRRFYSEAPIPPFHPAFGSLRVDALGWLWVQETRIDDDAPDRWILLDPDGRVAGAIDLPPRFRVEEIGVDYVLGRAVDDLGVNYVRLYALRRPDHD